jgi:GT2 family glycosyltransferase
MKIHCVTAVYNRQEKTYASIQDIYEQSKSLGIDVKFWVIEAGDYNLTLEIFNKYDTEILKIIDVPEDTFWTSGMEIGVFEALLDAEDNDLFILFNNDIRVPQKTLEFVLNKMSSDSLIALSPISVSSHDRLTISTGVIVKNWVFCWHRAPFVNLKIDDLVNFKLIEVDFMTQRFLCLPKKVLDLVGNYRSDKLPHYGGDYEFTCRMKRKGVKVILDPSFHIYIDEQDTGLNSRYKKLNIKQRLQSLVSLRSSSNIITAFKFSLCVSPLYAQPFNLIFMPLKAIIRALFFRPRN